MPGTRRALISGVLGAVACRVAPRGGRCVAGERLVGVDAPGDALDGAGGGIDGALDGGLVAVLEGALKKVHAGSRAAGPGSAGWRWSTRRRRWPRGRAFRRRASVN